MSLGLVIIAHADTVSFTPINPNIPGSNSPQDPVDLIVAVYRFALMGAGLLAFGAILWGSIRYTTAGGNTSTQGDARDQIYQAFLGLFLLLAGYLILRTINPAIVAPSLFDITGSLSGDVIGARGGRLPGVGAGGGGRRGGGSPGGGGSRGGGCGVAPPGNPCSVENMRAACAAWDPVRASRICNYESSGGQVGIPSGSDRCQPGREYVSWGLMQINLSANPIGSLNCPSAIGPPYTSTNHSCTVRDAGLYQQCITAAKDPTINLKTACALYQRAGGFSPWSNTARRCSI